MAVMIVRHAHALSRRDWDGEDRHRPLSPKGEKQARRLAGRLLELEPARILSSPYRRCLQTVQPLAVAAGMRVESDERLAEGEGRRALELVRAAGTSGQAVVLCSHGDVIPDVLAALANEDRVDLGPAPQVEKSSVWILHAEGRRWSTAAYIEPPKT